MSNVTDLMAAEAFAPAVMDQPLAEVLVRILVADGLNAQLTSPDRFEVSTATGKTMEWCCIAGVAFGRKVGDQGEAAWVHRVPAGGVGVVAPAEIGREIGRIVRGMT